MYEFNCCEGQCFSTTLFEIGPRFWFTAMKRILTDRQTCSHNVLSFAIHNQAKKCPMDAAKTMRVCTFEKKSNLEMPPIYIRIKPKFIRQWNRIMIPSLFLLSLSIPVSSLSTSVAACGQEALLQVLLRGGPPSQSTTGASLESSKQGSNLRSQ